MQQTNRSHRKFELAFFATTYRKVASINGCFNNMDINFFPKGQSKQTSNFPLIENLKKPVCVSKRDGLVFATLL